jgi:LPXTG-site transpeptidase (sortase) family protein
VPVLEATDDVSLNRAVGHIADTARPGTDGNSGIAGRGDGFFRGLKDITPGGAIQLETLRATEVYRVERTWIVDPEDVSVLDPTPTRSLTLVTAIRSISSARRRDGSSSVRRSPRIHRPPFAHNAERSASPSGQSHAD